MANAKYNIGLINAVSDLYKRGVITMDKDIVERMAPYKKNTVSGYIKGTVKASDAFLKKFEEVFELKLSSYESNTNRLLPLGEINITVADYIAKLESWNTFLQDLTGSNLTDLVSGQQTLYAYARVALEYQAALASRGDKTKEKELLDILSKRIELFEKGPLKQGSTVSNGK